MIGWELPPFNSGGLGVACLSLTRALAQNGQNITFVLPRKVNLNYDFMKILYANVNDTYEQLKNSYHSASLFYRITGLDDVSSDYIKASLEYADQILKHTKKNQFDVIHAHDWLTVPAALAVQKETHKPLVLHIHATEVDRSGGNQTNSLVYQLEKKGMQKADRVIAVSKFTKDIVVNKYGISDRKVHVVHNGVDEIQIKKVSPALQEFKKLGYKVVLFLGRITLQKGPEYFVRAAKRVLDYDKKVLFVVTGSGDMHEEMMSETVRLGISNSFLFTGFLRGHEREKIFQTADLYVMPSVSEPFGITALEAVAHQIPTIVSKQSGASEVLTNVMKVDFWDIEEMANKMLGVLLYEPLSKDMIWESSKELPQVTWQKSAEKTVSIYNSFLNQSL